MNVEIFSICDASTVHGGKLNLLGTFDSINIPQFPTTHAFCSIALRVRFERPENGEHMFRISIVDEDGNEIYKPLNGSFNVSIPRLQPSIAFNVSFNLQGLKFEKPGEYAANLEIDDEICGCLPVFVNQVQAPASDR